MPRPQKPQMAPELREQMLAAFPEGQPVSVNELRAWAIGNGVLPGLAMRTIKEAGRVLGD